MAETGMWGLMKRLFPICRSLTGGGVRQTLDILKEELPALEIREVASGSGVFNWTVPDEWNIASATLYGPDGDIVVDFANHNLHVLGYSEPVDRVLSLEELQPHLYSLPELPDAIPYVTSYFERRWGFCLPHRIREGLRPGMYRSKIESSLSPGVLNYGELIIPGASREEVLLSTYICHPSLANDNLSGPVVAVALAKWLSAADRRYTYRIVFVPETIGSIAYLCRNIEDMRARTVAGFVLTCLGDERGYSYLSSRLGDTLADKVAVHILGHFAPEFARYGFLERGSDERQYCAPGVDLPVCSVMRSKYGCFPEYHTSLDNLDFVTAQGLADGYEMIRKCLEALEINEVYQATMLCEPQMGKYGLMSTLSRVGSWGKSVKDLLDLLAYLDGKATLLEASTLLGWDIFHSASLVRQLLNHDIVRRCC